MATTDSDGQERVSKSTEEVEEVGLDLSDHGESGYSSDLATIPAFAHAE